MKMLRKFQAQLFSSQLTKSKAKFFIRKLAFCLWSIRAQADKIEPPHGLAVLQLSTSDSGAAGLLPYARGSLCFGEERPNQSQLVSFLVDSGSQVNIMSLSHLEKLQFSTSKVKPVQREYVIESSTEVKNNCIYGTLDLKIYLIN